MLAKIYRPARNAMQSGKAATRKWRLEFEPRNGLVPDALMGWASSSDPNRQIRMSFDTKEEAVAFAQAHGIPHQVTEPSEMKRIPKSYADNFAYTRREPWSH